MKKLVSLAIALMLVTVSVTSAFALDKPSVRMTRYEENGVTYYYDNETEYIFRYISNGKNSDGTEFVLTYNMGTKYMAHADPVWFMQIGSVLLRNYYAIDNYGYRTDTTYTVIINDEPFPVDYAYQNGLVEDMAVYNAMLASQYTLRSAFIAGDINLDGKVSVLDATLVQEYLVKLEDIDLELLEIIMFDDVYEVTVNNATKIQKYVANMIPVLKVK